MKQPKPIDNFNRLIQAPAMQSYLFSTLHDKRDTFVANVTALVGGNQQLQCCDPAAVIMTAIKATALDLPLDPNLGFAYVIPYQSREGLIPQFQLGYKGYIQLALRSGKFRTMNTRDVREGEILDEDYMSGELICRRAEGRESLPVVGYLAFFELTNGFRKSLYMSKVELEAHASRFSQTFKKGRGVWSENFDSMAKKTVMKLLLSRFAPMSVDMADALRFDGASTGKDGQPVYVDNGGDVAEVVSVASEPAEPTEAAPAKGDYAAAIMARAANPTPQGLDKAFSLEARMARAAETVEAQQEQQGEQPQLSNL